MLTAIVCPISNKKIDSYLSRVTVFLNVLLMLAFIITANPLFITIAVIDYAFRAFLNVKSVSPIKYLAKLLRQLLPLKPKYIDLASKVFAARLGFIISFTALMLFVFGYPRAAIGTTAFLMTLSILDSVFDFCVGCLVYNYLVFPFFNKKI